MSRFSTRSLLALATAALVVLPMSSAIAKGSGAARPGGKHPVGTIASFDPATMELVVAAVDGSQTITATVAPDVKVKVVHRGEHSVGRGHGNPSAGSLDDLVAGTFVLTLHRHDDVVTGIRVRPAPLPGA